VIKLPIERARISVMPGRPTTMWTYGGVFPGPTILARSGRPVRVRFVNRLPKGASVSTHFHGGHNPSRHDGQPHRYLVEPGEGRTYSYPLTFGGRAQRGAFLWYHDHRMNVTGRNIWRGLAGMFVLRDRLDRTLPLPKGRYDVPLMIVDRAFADGNRMPYPEGAHTMPPADAAVGPEILVNGVPQPYLEVAARRYRLRLLNASNFTSYNFRLGSGERFVQIAGGQGLLPRPVRRETILLGPAQRAEVVVDFHGHLGERVLLQSVPRAQTEPGVGSASADVMQFRVVERAPDHSRVPRTLRPRPRWVRRASPTADRTWVFGLGADSSGRTVWTINGRPFDHGRIDAEVHRGSIETWEFVNASTVTHLIHPHGVPFAALSRDGGPPDPWELGLEDTFRLDPGERLVAAAKFADYTGPYILHCHMLEHEDHGMMAQFRVTP
jgi:FtsP/CotA-like multicopper oxidase with cupredoxin domain